MQWTVLYYILSWRREFALKMKRKFARYQLMVDIGPVLVTGLGLLMKKINSTFLTICLAFFLCVCTRASQAI